MNRFICKTFQLLIRTYLQRIRYSLQPLRNIRVLEDCPFKFSLSFPCRNLKILNTMTRLNPFNTVVQDIPLVRYQHILHQTDVTIPEPILDMNLSYRNCIQGRHIQFSLCHNLTT